MITKNPRTLSLLFVVLVLALTIFTIYSISSEARTALKQSSQEELRDVATAIATQIDGDSFARIQLGDESTPAFLSLRDQLRKVKIATTDIHFIYTMRRDGSSAVFVVDADYGYTTDAARIGDPYPQAEPELMAGFSGPSADNEFTIDEWGTVLSGFSPIRDRSGAIVGLVGVDMDSNSVLASINQLNIIISLVGLVAVFLTTLGLLYVEYRRSLDERKVEESERKYRTLFEHAADAIFLVEADGPTLGKIVEANQSAADMHGYSPEELNQQSIHDLCLNNREYTRSEKAGTSLASGWLKGEHLHRKKDGSVFPIEFSATSLVIGDKTYLLVIDRDISNRKKSEESILQTTKKLNMLNAVTFNDIQNAVYSIAGYLAVSADASEEKPKEYREKEAEQIGRIYRTLDFARNYQDLGKTPPRWQNVEQVFLFAISHIDISSIQRTMNVKGLEVFADSLLERVFQTLTDNVVTKGKTATKVSLSYSETPDGLILVFEDNGIGIPDHLKEAVFERGFGKQKAMELFLVREILGITGITIRETGKDGTGARFEVHVPRGGYRFVPKPE